jgi:hypothetical protein
VVFINILAHKRPQDVQNHMKKQRVDGQNNVQMTNNVEENKEQVVFANVM